MDFCARVCALQSSSWLYFLLVSPATIPRAKMRTYQRRRKRQSAAEPVVKAANRPTKLKNLTKEQMARAIECAQSGTISYNKVAELHGIPKSTLKDNLSGRVEVGSLPGPRPHLQPSEEVELTSHLLSASKIGQGKLRYAVMRIAEGVGNHRRVLRGERISHSWWKRFIARNSSLSLRSGDATAGVRINVVNEENMQNYLTLLKEVYDELYFASHPEKEFLTWMKQACP